MPAKMDTDLNLRFLFMCFKHSNFSTIDYHKVAAYFEIKAPAARMRLMRLKNSLEADMNMNPQKETKKRPRPNPWNAPKCGKGFQDEDSDDKEELDDMPLMQRWRGIKQEGDVLVKNEDGSVWVKKEEGLVPVKVENGGSWVKKEKELDTQNDIQTVKAENRYDDASTFFKGEEEDEPTGYPTPVKAEPKAQDAPYGHASPSGVQFPVAQFRPAPSPVSQFRPTPSPVSQFPSPHTPVQIPGLQTPATQSRTPGTYSLDYMTTPFRRESFHMTPMKHSVRANGVAIKPERDSSVSTHVDAVTAAYPANTPSSVVTSPRAMAHVEDGYISPAVPETPQFKAEPERRHDSPFATPANDHAFSVPKTHTHGGAAMGYPGF